jgi:hypothetical protein
VAAMKAIEKPGAGAWSLRRLVTLNQAGAG